MTSVPVRQRPDLLLRHRHRLHPTLPGRGKHRRKRLLETRLRGSLIPGLREVTAGEARVVGEEAHHLLHSLQRAVVAPDVVQALGDREVDTHAAHQHELAHSVRMLGRDPQCNAAAEAVADQVCRLNAHGVHEPEGLVGPHVQAVPDAFRAVRVAESDHVRGVHTEVFAERGQHPAPVRIGRDPRPRAVDQHHGIATRARLKVVRPNPVGHDVLADRRVLGGGHSSSISFARGGSHSDGSGVATKDCLLRTRPPAARCSNRHRSASRTVDPCRDLVQRDRHLCGPPMTRAPPALRPGDRLFAVRHPPGRRQAGPRLRSWS